MQSKLNAAYWLSATSLAIVHLSAQGAAPTDSNVMEEAWSGKSTLPQSFPFNGKKSFEPLGARGIKLINKSAPSYVTFTRLDLQLSRVDDTATIWFNGIKVQESAFGTSLPFVDVTNMAHDGENTVHVVVGNGAGGGCGAVVTARFDQNNALVRSWEWRKSWEHNFPNCVDDTFTIWRYSLSAPPAGFHVIEIKMDEVDDNMYVDIEPSQRLDQTYMQYAKPWHDVSKFFFTGDNFVHVRITNEGGGGCGGRLSLLVDGSLYAPPDWRWRRDWFPSDAGPCFDERILVNIP